MLLPIIQHNERANGALTPPLVTCTSRLHLEANRIAIDQTLHRNSGVINRRKMLLLEINIFLGQGARRSAATSYRSPSQVFLILHLAESPHIQHRFSMESSAMPGAESRAPDLSRANLAYTEVRPGLDARSTYSSFNASVFSLRTQNQDFHNASSWSEHPLPMISWASKRIDMRLGWGSGQKRTPFSCTREDFDTRITEFGFSNKLIRTRRSFFEHRFLGYPGTDPVFLEMAVSTYEHHAFLCLFRTEISGPGVGSTKCLLFLKPLMTIFEEEHRIREVLDTHRTDLDLHPLLMLNVVLSLLQADAHDFLKWRQQIYSIEARLGVSRDSSKLPEFSYPMIDYNFTILNADLASTARVIADNALSVNTMLDHARALLRIISIYEEIKDEINASPAPTTATPRTRRLYSLQQEEVQATIVRAQLYLHQAKMTQNVLTRLTAVLYDRINKSDTRSMKTIAIVKLLFLPSTFVSAIF